MFGQSLPLVQRSSDAACYWELCDKVHNTWMLVMDWDSLGLFHDMLKL